MRTLVLALLAFASGLSAGSARAASSAVAPAAGELAATTIAVLDLTSAEGLRQVQGVWRYREAQVVEVDFPRPGPDRKPTGPPGRTFDIVPRAGGRDFDDSGFEVVDPATLSGRRAGGKLCFAWYRLGLILPERIGGVPMQGATVTLEVVVDDYAEVWVDGVLPRVLGQSGGTMVRGFNAPNRVVLARDARPGQRIQVAVFAANGPLSDPPPNYIWMRLARLEVERPLAAPRALAPVAVETEVLRLDVAVDRIVPPGARIEKLAEGFRFTEGPLWLEEGALLFSDPNANRIYRWRPPGELAVFKDRSGYDGADVASYTQPGSNGLALDGDGRLTIDEHGNRRVTRLEPDGRVTTLADRFQGKRLNSPNDLVYRSDGSLYFTNPPFGLPGFHQDTRRELAHAGVYRLGTDGALELLDASLEGPNGLAFSPDERHLYIGNWDPLRKVVMRYPVAPGGGLGEGTVFLNLTAMPGEEAIDGVKVDRDGNLYVSGPGGLWIVSPEGKPVGIVRGPEPPANFAWGDADSKTLYLAARTGLYRLRLMVPGAGAVGVARASSAGR